MTTTPDPASLAREALALAEKAVHGPYTVRSHGTPNLRDIDMPGGTLASVAVWRSGVPGRNGEAYATARFLAHAGTHYATLARALLDAEERAVRLEALLSECVDLLEARDRHVGAATHAWNMSANNTLARLRAAKASDSSR